MESGETVDQTDRGSKAGAESRRGPSEPQGDGKGYRPRADLVADWIRQQIVEGHLAPGDRIRQEAVAEVCGTSRIPVREALNRLRDEGLVTLTSHVGARVATFDFDELHEIYALRERLEPYALSESVPLLRDDKLQELREYVEMMESEPVLADPAAWVETDRRFHLASYSAAPLPRLLELVNEFWNRTQQYRRAYIGLPSSPEVALLEHRLLLDAIERKDPGNAEAIQAIHIRRTRLGLDRHAEQIDATGREPRRTSKRSPA